MKKLVALLMALVLALSCTAAFAEEAAAATAVAFKRIMDGAVLPELRCYQKGICHFRNILFLKPSKSACFSF